MTPTYSLENEFQQWLKSRPKAVQEFAAKLDFRPGDHFFFLNPPKGLCEPDIEADRMYYLIGYFEDKEDNSRVGIMLSDIDPRQDYASAMEHTYYICADHFDGTDAVQLTPIPQAVH